MTYQVRALGVADVDAYRQVRLAALRLHPDAFGSAYEDEAALDRAQFAERLTAADFTRFGGFAAGDLVGLAGLQIRSGAKERHKARLFSMYVDAAHRGGGLAQQLIAAVAGAREVCAARAAFSGAGNARPTVSPLSRSTASSGARSELAGAFTMKN
jgi:GNAT superfamily N-acetyltransferase